MTALSRLGDVSTAFVLLAGSGLSAATLRSQSVVGSGVAILTGAQQPASPPQRACYIS